MKLAVVGAGWAGLAAAVTAVQAGAEVVLYEMAAQPGGRARDVAATATSATLDNGQHICIGAYVETLRLMRAVGVDPAAAFLRQPLTLVDPHGRGLRLGAGPATLAFALAVARHAGWSWRDKASLLALSARWQASGFTCAASVTVSELVAGLSPLVREGFVEPLCVAALNTPAAEASGQVFLRVLRDSLQAGHGSADLLLPRVGLGAVLPLPAVAWLSARGATLRSGHRVARLTMAATGAGGGSVEIDGSGFDAAVIATSAVEAARLASASAPAWSASAAAFDYEPIATVYAQADGCRLPEPMLALPSDAALPAQFVFDRGQLGGPAGLLAFVISGARPWVERGSEALVEATLAQGRQQLASHLRSGVVAVRTIVEKRATFRCVPSLARPPMQMAPRLWAAGDYVDGPYPATLEGAVRSGIAAARAALG